VTNSQIRRLRSVRMMRISPNPLIYSCIFLSAPTKRSLSPPAFCHSLATCSKATSRSAAVPLRPAVPVVPGVPLAPGDPSGPFLALFCDPPRPTHPAPPAPPNCPVAPVPPAPPLPPRPPKSAQSPSRPLAALGACTPSARRAPAPPIQPSDLIGVPLIEAVATRTAPPASPCEGVVVNASPIPSRVLAHDSGSMRFGRVGSRPGPGFELCQRFLDPPIIPYGGFSPIRLEGWLFRWRLSDFQRLSLLPTFATCWSVCIHPSYTS
jgi:hypothetical protein